MTHEELKEYLSYNPETGIFIWIKRLSKKVLVGSEAGSIRKGKKNYVIISWKGYPYYAHRLAWFYMTGEMPALIDHKDRNELNNKFENLRDVSQVVNMANVTKSRRNSSGYPGVTRIGNRWQARIVVNQQFNFLGAYSSFEDAVQARKAAEVKLCGENRK